MRLYNPESDPKPIYKKNEIIEEDSDEKPEVDDSSQFAYESHLRDYLVNNLHQIEPGLQLFRDEEDNTITETMTSPADKISTYTMSWVNYNGKVYLVTSLTRAYQKVVI